MSGKTIKERILEREAAIEKLAREFEREGRSPLRAELLARAMNGDRNSD